MLAERGEVRNERKTKKGRGQDGPVIFILKGHRYHLCILLRPT